MAPGAPPSRWSSRRRRRRSRSRRRRSPSCSSAPSSPNARRRPADRAPNGRPRWALGGDAAAMPGRHLALAFARSVRMPVVPLEAATGVPLFSPVGVSRPPPSCSTSEASGSRSTRWSIPARRRSSTCPRQAQAILGLAPGAVAAAAAAARWRWWWRSLPLRAGLRRRACRFLPARCSCWRRRSSSCGAPLGARGRRHHDFMVREHEARGWEATLAEWEAEAGPAPLRRQARRARAAPRPGSRRATVATARRRAGRRRPLGRARPLPRRVRPRGRRGEGRQPRARTAARVLGIATAADIDSAKLEAVPKLDKNLRDALIEWRLALEQRFLVEAVPIRRAYDELLQIARRWTRSCAPRQPCAPASRTSRRCSSRCSSPASR